MTTLLQELINFRKKKPEVKPIQYKDSFTAIKDPVIARTYREMRKAYQRIVANRNKSHADPEALKLVYQQLSAPLISNDKNAFKKIMHKWPTDPEEANAYSDIMGRLLNSLGIEDVDFSNSDEMWAAIEKAVKELDDDEET
jgi:hypothetical protein